MELVTDGGGAVRPVGTLVFGGEGFPFGGVEAGFVVGGVFEVSGGGDGLPDFIADGVGGRPRWRNGFGAAGAASF